MAEPVYEADLELAPDWNLTYEGLVRHVDGLTDALEHSTAPQAGRKVRADYAHSSGAKEMSLSKRLGPKRWAFAGLWLDPNHAAPLIEGPQPKDLQSRAREPAEPRKRACLRRSWRAKAMVGNT